MRIAIIGAGFYGTYIAYKLSEQKKYEVSIFEKNKNICCEAASNNQYRLHTGFHYPRSIDTVKQTIKGYKLFLKEFCDFVDIPNENLYLINKRSKINFKNYKKIFKNLKVPSSEVNLKNYRNLININNFQSAVNTKEGVIKIKKLIIYLKRKIKNKVNLYLNTEITKIDNLNGSISTKNKIFNNYDLIINTTYCDPNLGLQKKRFDLKYEIAAILKLKNPFKTSLGLTVMDGKFCSLYPYDDKFSTLSSVKYTPIYKSRSYHLIKSKKILKNQIIKRIINHARKDFKLPKKITNKSLILSYKVKINNDSNDVRTSNFIRENKQISILCGKLDAALVIYKEIKKFIK